MDLTGQQLGKYELIESLGQGGMAQVYKANQRGLDRIVAVKVMHNHLAKTGDFVQRFQQEARMVGQLQHKNILRVIDFDIENDTYYLVMDYIKGGTLDNYLAQHGGILPVIEAMEIIAQLADALDYAHKQGTIHRDIKPGNVMFLNENFTDPVLTDFGLARMAMASEHLTATGTILGTPAYMSPEAMRGEKVDERGDIFSLGVVLYQLVTGRVPYTGDTPFSIITKRLTEPLPPPREVKPDLPDVVEKIILKALADVVAERYQTAGEFKADLEGALYLLSDEPTMVQQPISITAVNMQPSPSKPKLDLQAKDPQAVEPATQSQRRVLQIAMVAVLLAAVSIAIAVYVVSQGPPRPNPGIASNMPALSGPQVGYVRVVDNEFERAATYIVELGGANPDDAFNNVSIEAPPDNHTYHLWFVEDDGLTTFDATDLPFENGAIEFEGNTGRNLLRDFTGVFISLELIDDPDPRISDQIVFAGFVPPAVMVEVRNMVVDTPNPDVDQGSLVGAQAQIALAISHAGFLRNSLNDDDFAGALRHAEHIVNILDGADGPHFGDLDDNGRAENPGDGYGLVRYLSGAENDAARALDSLPDSAVDRIEVTQRVVEAIDNADLLVDDALDKALQVFSADSVQEARPISAELSRLLTQALGGIDLNDDGVIDPDEGEGGIDAAYRFALLMAEFQLSVYEAP